MWMSVRLTELLAGGPAREQTGQAEGQASTPAGNSFCLAVTCRGVIR